MACAFRMFVCDLPDRCGLFKVKQAIQLAVGDNDAVQSITYLKDHNNSRLDSTAEVQLKNDEHVAALLRMKKITVTFRDEEYELKITNVSPVLQSFTFRKPVENAGGNKGKIKRPTNSLTAADNVSRQVTALDETQAERQQRRIFCTNIPNEMFSEEKMRQHFIRFGEISDFFLPEPLRDGVKPFVKIRFRTHNEAESAIREGRDLRHSSQKLLIYWDRTEAHQVESDSSTKQRRSCTQPISQTASSFSSSRLSDSRSTTPRESFASRFCSSSEKTTVTWADLVSTDKHLFSGPSDRCVLIVGKESITTKQSLEYFQKSGYCTRDEVEKTCEMLDGTLVAFSKTGIVDRILDCDSHIIDGRCVKVILKPIPPLCDDRVLLEGSLSAEEVQTLLDICDSAAGSKITVLEKCKKFLVEFQGPIDIQKFIRDFEAIPLEEINVKATQLCRSDCLQVENLSDDIKNDFVKLTFTNKKYGCTGKVTGVKRMGSGVGLVYFADYRDAQRVYEAAHQLTVCGKPVQVSIYYNGLLKERHHKNTTKFQSQSFAEKKPDTTMRMPSSFDFSPSVSREVTDFIRLSPEVIEQLKKEVKNIAEVELVEKSSTSTRSNSPLMLRIRPFPKTSAKFASSQVKFEEECQRNLMNVLSQLCSKSKTFDAKNLAELRRTSLWKNNPDIIKVQVDAYICAKVYVRWSFVPPGHVTVAGFAKDVTDVLEYLTQICDVIEETLSVSPSQYRALEECGSIEEIKRVYQEKVRLHIDSKLMKFTLTGPRAVVTRAKTEILKEKKKLISLPLSNLPGGRTEFLVTALRNEEKGLIGYIAIREIVQAELKKSSVKASLQLVNSRAYFLCTKRSEGDRAQRILVEMIKHKDMNVGKGFNELVNSSEWKRFRQNLCSSGNVEIFVDKKMSAVSLCGLSDAFDARLDELQKYVEEHMHVTVTITQPYIVVRYLEKYMGDRQGEVVENVEIDFESDVDDELAVIVINGKKKNVEEAADWIQHRVSCLTVAKRCIREPGLAVHFRSDDGKAEVKFIAEQHSCVAVIDPTAWQRNLPDAHSSEDSDSVDSDTSEGPWIATKHRQAKTPSPNEDNLYFNSNAFASSSCVQTPSCEESTDIPQAVNHSPTAAEPISPDLVVKIGDICQISADVVVTSTSTQDFGTGASSTVSKAVFDGAGPGLQVACQSTEHSNLDVGQIIRTPGFDLSCNEVYHVVLEEYEQKNGKETLINVINMCLTLADSTGYNCIAFPALGAGGFKYPADEVKQVLQSAVGRFKAVNLKTVVLALYSSDANVLKTSDISFCLDTAGPSKTTSPSGQKCVRVAIAHGSIIDSAHDAIINPTENFDLSGSIGKAIVANGGQSIADECALNCLRSSPNYRITRAGNLPSKYVIHLAVPKIVSQLPRLLEDVFQVAEDLGMTSLAMPAIGTGKIGLQCEDVAKSIQLAVDSFGRKQPKSLKQIEVRVMEKYLVAGFKQFIVETNETDGETATFTEKTQVNTARSPAQHERNQKRKRFSVEVLLCSTNKMNIIATWTQIQKAVQQLLCEKTIDDSSPEEWTEVDRELQDIAEKYCVQIAQSCKSELPQLVLRGLKSNVLEAHQEAIRLIHQIKEALLCAEYVVWRHIDQQSRQMQEFSIRTSNKIEKAYKKNISGSVVVDIFVDGSKQQFNVDFAQMKEICLSTQQITSVERLTKAAEDSLPSHWDDMDGQSHKVVTLASTSEEYISVMQQFNVTHTFNVLQLKRIQNPTLYKQFQAQKKKVEGRMGSGAQVTRQLFHGTSGDVCDKIYKDGFDRSHAGKHATAFGQGVYFATTSQYSLGYAVADSSGHKHMFLTEVITGQYCRGTSLMRTAPMQANGAPFDSVVNNIDAPTMFVVFKDASVYPSYILTFL